MGDSNQSKKERSKKCESCYLNDDCMLTPEMSKRCGGPFADERARREFIKKEIVDKKE